MTQKHFRFALLCIAIFFVSLVLRLWGIQNGLPHVQRPDEVSDITQSLQLINGQTPVYAYHRVAWPIMQIPVHGLHFLVNKISHPNYSVGDFEASYFTNRWVFILSTRVYLAIFSAFTCVLAGYVGYLVSNSRGVFFVSGTLLAVHPAHTYLSHIALPDAFSTFGVVCCILGVVVIINKAYRWAYWLAGFSAALAMLTRLQVLPLVISLIVIAHVIAWGNLPQRSWRFLLFNWLWAFGGFVIGHLLFNPYILFEPQAVWGDILFIFNERFTGINNWQPEYNTFRPLANFAHNIRLPIIFLRPYIIVVFISATVMAVIKRHKAVLVICATSGLFIVSLLPTTIPRITFWLPATVPLSITVGWLLWTLWQSRQKWLSFSALVLIPLLLIAGLVETITIDYLLSQPDTQTLAYNYITNEIPESANILIGDTFVYSVPLQRNMVSIERLRRLETLPPTYQFFVNNPDRLLAPAYNIYGYEFIPQIQSDIEMRLFIVENAIDYVVEVDYCGEIPPYELTTGLTFPVVRQSVRTDLDLVYNISPFGRDDCLQHIENRTHMEYMQLWDWERVGPIIRVYKTSAQE